MRRGPASCGPSANAATVNAISVCSEPSGSVTVSAGSASISCSTSPRDGGSAVIRSGSVCVAMTVIRTRSPRVTVRGVTSTRSSSGVARCAAAGELASAPRTARAASASTATASPARRCARVMCGGSGGGSTQAPARRRRHRCARSALRRPRAAGWRRAAPAAPRLPRRSAGAGLRRSCRSAAGPRARRPRLRRCRRSGSASSSGSTTTTAISSWRRDRSRSGRS